MKRIEQKALKFLNSQKLIEKKDQVIVALSGGPDSVFLLHFLQKYKSLLSCDIIAVHINHNLRNSESDKDQIFCREFCNEKGIELIEESVDVKSKASEEKMSIEEAARELRYKILDRICSEKSFNKIATAHNSNDNTESILFNFFKGTGLRGLKGIPIKRGKIIRPILNITKTEILEYLEYNQINYRIDSSNAENHFKRNFLRNKIVPLIKNDINENLENTLFRNSQVVSSSLKVIDNYVEKISSDIVLYNDEKVIIPINVINDFTREDIAEVLIRKIPEIFGIEFNYNTFEKVNQLFDKQVGKKEFLLSDLVVFRERDSIVVYKEDGKDLSEIEVDFGKEYSIKDKSIKIDLLNSFDKNNIFNENYEFVDGDKIQNIIILRKWKNGDKFIPLGMSGFKTVSDFLTDEKVSSIEKKNQLVLTDNDDRVFCVVGKRIDDRYKIRESTKKVLRIWIK